MKPIYFRIPEITHWKLRLYGKLFHKTEFEALTVLPWVTDL